MDSRQAHPFLDLNAKKLYMQNQQDSRISTQPLLGTLLILEGFWEIRYPVS